QLLEAAQRLPPAAGAVPSRPGDGHDRCERLVERSRARRRGGQVDVTLQVSMERVTVLPVAVHDPPRRAVPAQPAGYTVTPRAAGARLVGRAAVFTAACAPPSCADLFFPEQQPTAKGYTLAARSLVQQLTPAP